MKYYKKGDVKMNKEKDFFKTCFDTVAGLEVKNESQAIAKEVVLSEIRNSQEENEKLKEEITNLFKDVDMWNSKYNDMFDENRMLKEALETKSYCKYANKCDELDDYSREEYENMANANVRLKVENCDLKDENQELKLELSGYRQAILNNKEMLGLKEQNQKLKNQLEEYKDNYNCLLKQKEQFEYIMSKQVDYRGQQKEFIEWLENVIEKVKNAEFLDERIQRAGLIAYNRCLQKYKEIVKGGNDNE